MDDLVIKINLKESTQQYCLVETYLGTLKKLKKRTYSGPIKPVDILTLDRVQNISHDLLEQLKDFLLNEARQIKKNKYLLQYVPLLGFFSIISGVRGVYSTSYDNALYELDNLYRAELRISDSKSLNQGRLYLEVLERDKTFLDKNTYFKSICGKTFVFLHNNLYILKNDVNPSKLKKVALNNSKLSEEEYTELFFNQQEKAESTSNLICIKPVPILYLKINDSYINGKLLFSYNGFEVPYNSPGDRIADEQNGCYYFRSIIDEKRAVSEVVSAGWQQGNANNFIYDNFNSFSESLSCLLNKQFELLTNEKKRIYPSSKANFNISYGMDWFELKVIDESKHGKVNLTHLIDVKSRKRYVELDNEIILLPNTLYENLRAFKQEGEKLKATKKQIGEILEILADTEMSSEFSFEDIIALENIELKLPITLDNILRPYQKEGVCWLQFLFENNLGGCLADDMGLGKTIQAISFIVSNNLKKNGPTSALIVAPKTLLENWRNELERYGEGLNVSIYHGVNREEAISDFDKNNGVLLTTYNTLLIDLEILSKIHFDCMFIDEAQYIKNYKAKTYKAAQRIKVRSKFLLSGTPFENNFSELWALMDLINPGYLGRRLTFIKKYGTLEDEKAIKKLNARIKPFVLRRLKKDVLKDLPEKTEQKIICEMDEGQRELYESIIKSIRNELVRMPSRFEIKDASVILEGLLYLRQICCHPALLKSSLNWNKCNTSGKFELFKMKIKELQANREKVVVFSQFTSMLNLMKRWADRCGYKTFYLDGTSSNRQELVNSFEQSDEGIFFISLKAGGVGLNIVSCQYAIIYDPWWNPAVENQAADRIYRIGQTKNVFIYHLITADSIEEKIEELKSRKKEVADNLLVDTDKSTKLSIEELKRLLME